jgi:hypothetical protein
VLFFDTASVVVLCFGVTQLPPGACGLVLCVLSPAHAQQRAQVVAAGHSM